MSIDEGREGGRENGVLSHRFPLFNLWWSIEEWN